MIPEVLGNALLLLGFAFLGITLGKLLRLEMTLACLLTGLAAGQLLAPLGLDTGVRAHNVEDLVFYILLPPLLFLAAWHVKLTELRQWLLPIITLSTAGVGLSALTTAILTYFLFDHPGSPWLAAMLAGAILAAIDPVAVVTKLREEHAADDVTTLIEGESLLNDATAAILFGLILACALNADAPLDAASTGLLVLRHLLMAPLVGGVLGLVFHLLIRYLSSTTTTHGLLVFAAFSSFFIAESGLHVSGIISVVTTGICMRWLFSRHAAVPSADLEITWDWLGELWVAFTYMLMGLVIVPAMFLDQWLAALMAIPVALISRWIAVYASTWPATALGFRQAVPNAWRPLLVWGGLRGAIAIALVLVLPTELPYWYTLQAMVFSVVLFSSLVQGTTTGWLVRRLGLAGQPNTTNRDS
ncbi:MAG: cation:proton antiporter [Chromatocurvus sp.]